MTEPNYSRVFLPLNKDGQPDYRFNKSLDRIRSEIGEQTIKELSDFSFYTSKLQKGYSKQGLDFAIAVFKEALYLQKHHRFDKDNPYEYKSKVLKKQAQQTLERIGFTKNNAHKLVTTAAWVTCQIIGNDELKWFESLTPSHLYELSRMSCEGFKLVQKQVSYPEFNFSAGQQEISVRQLEEIRRSYPKKEMPDSKASRIPQLVDEVAKKPSNKYNSKVVEVCATDVYELTKREPALDSGQVSNAELVEQFTVLAQAIDWSTIGCDEAARGFLTSIEETLSFIADLAHESRYSPVM